MAPAVAAPASARTMDGGPGIVVGGPLPPPPPLGPIVVGGGEGGVGGTTGGGGIGPDWGGATASAPPAMMRASSAETEYLIGVTLEWHTRGRMLSLSSICQMAGDAARRHAAAHAANRMPSSRQDCF